MDAPKVFSDIHSRAVAFVVPPICTVVVAHTFVAIAHQGAVPKTFVVVIGLEMFASFAVVHVYPLSYDMKPCLCSGQDGPTSPRFMGLESFLFTVSCY